MQVEIDETKDDVATTLKSFNKDFSRLIEQEINEKTIKRDFIVSLFLFFPILLVISYPVFMLSLFVFLICAFVLLFFTRWIFTGEFKASLETAENLLKHFEVFTFFDARYNLNVEGLLIYAVLFFPFFYWFMYKKGKPFFIKRNRKKLTKKLLKENGGNLVKVLNHHQLSLDQFIDLVGADNFVLDKEEVEVYLLSKI